MSHKRPSKRGINAIDYTNSDYSPTSKSVPQKRPRIEQYSEFQVQTKSSDETPSVRRRSSRAPKPKVFDDEYMDTGVRSPGSDREVQKKKDPKASVSRNQGERRSIDDGLVVIDDQDTTTRRSSRVPKPKIFDEDYVEPTKIKGNNDKNEKIMVYATDSKILQDEQKDVSQKSKIQNKDKVKSKISSKNINQQDVDIVVGPKKTVAGAQKPKKTNSNGKHVKASPIAESELPPQRPLKSNEELDAKGSPKVRTSSRTPVPKKTFALIDDSPISKPAESIQGEEDLHMGVLSQGPHGSKPSKKISLTQSDSSLTSGEEIDIIYASPFIGKKKGNSKLQEAGSDGEKKKKKSKKSKAGSDSLDVSKDIMARETTKHLEGKKSGNVMGNITKDKSKKGSSKEIDSKIDVNKGDVKRKKKGASESIVDVKEMPKEVKKKSKKKKLEVEVALQQNISNAANSTPGSHEDKHSFSEHGKKSSKHSKTKHKDEPHSEVKDEDHHIILKVHLPHTEGSHHSHSSHKKHKHSSESRSGTESDSKAKKRKLSLESDSSSEDKHKKKLSIKFKGLSSSTPGVEFEGAKEPVGIEKGKKNKDLGSEGTNKKASKKAADDKPSVASSSDEKEHVRVVIKKTKQDIKLLTDDGEKSVKKGANKGGKEKAKEDKEQKTEASTSSKTTPKKKSKVGESPKSAEKEKRKIVSGYLLFCKKERSRINEANPGLEFAQISQKVGEAWKNLPESTRQEWKAKANDVKRTLLVQQEQKKTETTCTKSGTDAVDMAAHLKLLGESLSVIGASLMAQRETEVHGSLSVLLDSILCAICPLTFLTSHIPGIPGIAKDKQFQILDDLAYTMPGLG